MLLVYDNTYHIDFLTKSRLRKSQPPRSCDAFALHVKHLLCTFVPHKSFMLIITTIQRTKGKDISGLNFIAYIYNT